MREMRFFWLFLSFIVICSCARVVVYNDSRPAYLSQVLNCPTSQIHANVSFLYLERISEGKNFIDWPTGLEFENKIIFRFEKPNLALEVKMANPKRERVEVYFCNEDYCEGIYQGSLPFQEFRIPLLVKEAMNQEAWIEFSKNGEVMCLTGRALYRFDPIKNVSKNEKEK